MSIQYLDPEGQLPEHRAAELTRGFRAMMNADQATALQAVLPSTKDEDSLVRAFGFHYLGDLYHFQWDFPLSLTAYEKAADLFAENGHDRGHILNQMRLADIYVDEAESSGDAATADMRSAEEQAHALLDEATARAEALGDQFLIGFGLHYKALFKTADEDWPAAAELAQRAVQVRSAMGDEIFVLSSQALLARARAELGDFDAAEELAESTFKLQMQRDLRAPSLATLQIISVINDRRSLARTKELTSKFTAVEPIARTPFIFGDVPEEELAVMAHSGETVSPIVGSVGRTDRKRSALVTDPEVKVSALHS
ncbi:hypothetical protein OHT76_29970 [Streptomyces sp. NBC_00287]|uniref:hypothetical protein n=1 Tax=Streptomyces sp. NBC_00287 TaxID=2975702 RepID=UPI002E29845E|nr:hypothetical protein [Streptomyces sp. NBC_00287]